MSYNLKTKLLSIYFIFQIILLIYLAFNFILLCLTLWLLYGLGAESLYHSHFMFIKMVFIFCLILFLYIFSYFIIFKSAQVTKKIKNNIHILKSEKIIMYVSPILIIANIIIIIVLFPIIKIVF